MKRMIFSPSRAHQDEWGREFDRNNKLVSGRVSEWCLLASTFPCVCVAAAAAATNF